MATYYVDPANGDDSNNGLGPDASHGSDRPFATIGKLIAAGGAMVSGDTAYLAPGVYRETVTVGITSPTAETKIIGDPLNRKGFKTSGGASASPGYVRWTGFTTNDTTAASTSDILSSSTKDYFTIESIFFQTAGAGSEVSLTNSENWTFRNCVFEGGGAVSYLLYNSTANGVANNLLVDRCLFVGRATTGPLHIVVTPGASSADLAIVVKNCAFIVNCTNGAVCVSKTGSGAGLTGGVTISGCMSYGTRYGIAQMQTTATYYNTSYPMTATGCLVVCHDYAVSANANDGCLTEDYNKFITSSTVRNNVAAGANTVVNGDAALSLAWLAQMWGFLKKNPFEPQAGSPCLGFANWGSLTEDFFGRLRPAGGGSLNEAVGCFELHDFAGKDTATKDAGDAAPRLDGPGDHDLKIPVDASATNISIKLRYDTNHGTGNKPQAILLANPAIGVSEETKTMSEGVDTWETLAFTEFTPNSKGWVTVRIISRAAAGNGKCWFDTLTVT